MEQTSEDKTNDNLSRPLPHDFYTLHQLIIDRKSKFSKRLVQIADFLLSTPSYTIAFGKITEIAQAAEVQPSALVRFAKNLGYSGFSELQSIYRDHASRFWPDYSERIDNINHQDLSNEVANQKKLLNNFIESSHQSLNILEHNINYKHLDKMVDMLADAETICLIGTERVYSIVMYMTYIFRRAGIKCEYADDAGGLARNQIELLGKKDAILTISYTPYASKTLDLVFFAKELGIPIAAITDSSFSPLVHKANIWLEITEANYSGFRSLTATFAVVSMLAIAINTKRKK
ncbi:MurR/RpiR family transcriptional regulator [Commensalibacter papalotli (ex Botero et al. 2024)]|uniref:MurR/RpiR family n=1 Tax=Commensalibacter papalotli (ex Botero et al. 2024) TaxID=2972766 RepID=A0ABM9HU34_9PROT|nr:MurR/RpiR family transcriptional regulator [Commensalibacter papalotli (ex Botero et al. 2024)]CAI3956152.1 DNA-binding transcriptional regulator [Commensalibacter papalotli (ex Botero et al. 2024)]CAI3956306.1 DNA-binding transcriptional regulator [Commensalibacter papalotli (ex Botero et al. 2024)]